MPKPLKDVICIVLFEKGIVARGPARHWADGQRWNQKGDLISRPFTCNWPAGLFARLQPCQFSPYLDQGL